jgi:hypothetical protein
MHGANPICSSVDKLLWKSVVKSIACVECKRDFLNPWCSGVMSAWATKASTRISAKA